MHLYFGCRHKDEDYIYKQELQEFTNTKALASLHCAFSRDQEERVYVQHLLQKNKDEVYRMIKDNGRIYICGNTQMGKDVSKVLVEIFQEKEGKTLDEA
jgi:NADPH-ferrihemoprotein reductase